MSKLKYAVIGVGSIAKSHVRSFTAHPEVELVGATDAYEPALAKLSSSHPGIVVSTDCKTMLEKAKPDVVSICTPNKFHSSLTQLAFENGAHVLCEKPMAMDVAEAEAMEAARAKAGKIGMINFSYRTTTSFRYAREIVRQGDLGQLCRIHVVYLQSFLGASGTPWAWRNDKSLAGFGALGDLGVHMIDAARFITGLEFTRVVGTAQTMIKKKKDPSGQMKEVTTDTNASFLAQFTNGMLGTFETTQVAPGYGNHFRVEISGEHGTLAVLSSSPGDIWMFAGKTLSSNATWTTSMPQLTIPTTFASTQGRLEPSLLIDVIQKRSNDYPSFHDGLNAQRVLEGIFDSEKTNAWVQLKN